MKSQGDRLFREDQVHIDDVYDTDLDARVGSRRSAEEVYVDWEDARSGFLAAGCSCDRYDAGEPCEHIWATILAADAEGLGPRKGTSRLTVVLEDPDEEDDWGYDEPSDPWEEAFGRQSRYDRPGTSWASQMSGTTRSSAGRKSGWRQRLSAMLEDRDAARSEPQALAVFEKAREAWYLLDVETSLLKDAPFIRFFQREAKKNGEFGQWKVAGVATKETAQFTIAEDRELLPLLLAANENRVSAYSPYGGYSSYDYSGYEPRTTSVLLARRVYESLLPKLCATGRFVWANVGDLWSFEEQTRRLAWDDGPPWHFPLRIDADDAKKRWTFQGQLAREGEAAPVPLDQPPMLLTSGLVLWNDRLARFDPGKHSAWVKALRDGPAIDVPYRDRWALLGQLWQLPSLPDIDLPANLRGEEVRASPQPRLVVHSPEQHGPNRLYGDIEFLYDGQKVSPKEPAAGIVDAKQQRILVRDLAKEQEFLRELAGRGARAPDYSGSRQHDVWIPHQRFSGLVDELVQSGWIVEAEGYRIRKPGMCHLSVVSGVDWFDLEGACDFEGAQVQLPDLLEAVSRGQNYVQLGDGTRGLLPKQWLEQFAALAGLGKTEGEHVRFRPTQALLLDALLAAQGEVRVDRQFAEIRQKLRSFEGVSPAKEPEGFQGQLRDYQRLGLGWLYFLRDFNFGGCLADDMGLGKTIQVLAMLQARRVAANGKPDRPPSLVVVPRSLVFNWLEEARRFTPDLRVLDYTGLARKGTLDQLGQYDLVVTTYGTMQRDIAQLKDVRFDYAILDEAQAIKNAQAQRAKAARLLQADHRLAMTGTPVENHLGELWSLFEFLNPGMLGTSTVFQRLSRRVGGSDEELAMLRRALAPFILRRTKAQVLAELPEKTEQTLYCELEPKQRKQYDELRDYYRAVLSKRIEESGLAKSKIHVLEALLRLRQAACHPGLLDKKHTGQPSAKLDSLLEQLREVIDEGHKALVFSQFTSFLAIVRRRLDEAKITYEYLDGRTRDRKQRVDRFQTDPACPLFLISLKAGGHGLNLTAAEYVFILDPWWNPAVEAQAVDRIHRIGQTRQVFAYRLIAKDTVEEKVVELQKTKRHLAEAIVSADGSLLRDLTADDLRWLLT